MFMSIAPFHTEEAKKIDPSGNGGADRLTLMQRLCPQIRAIIVIFVSTFLRFSSEK